MYVPWQCDSTIRAGPLVPDFQPAQPPPSTRLGRHAMVAACQVDLQNKL